VHVHAHVGNVGATLGVRVRPAVLLLVGLVACGSSKSNDSGSGSRAGSGGDAGTSGAGGSAGEGGSGTSGDAGAGAASGAPGSTLRFTGTAMADIESMGGAGGASDGGAGGEPSFPEIDRVECSFSGEILDPIADDSGGWSGIAVGEVFRNIYSGDQRWEFSALIGGPATLTSLGDGRVELRAFGDQTGAKPFWTEIEVLEARATGADTYEGSWTCATLDIRDPGFPDVSGTAPGAWELAPAP
jgi:hypothetical protein